MPPRRPIFSQNSQKQPPRDSFSKKTCHNEVPRGLLLTVLTIRRERDPGYPAGYILELYNTLPIYLPIYPPYIPSGIHHSPPPGTRRGAAAGRARREGLAQGVAEVTVTGMPVTAWCPS